MSSLRLSDAEIAELCDLTQPAAQERHLRRQFPGLPIRRRSNGKVLILRADAQKYIHAENIEEIQAQPAYEVTQPRKYFSPTR